MKVDHVFGGHIYVISNFGVARNPIFKNNDDVEFFKSNIDKYLGEICEIYAYGNEYNQFQYLVKIHERPILEAFFYRKQSSEEKNAGHNLYSLDAITPPDSYLIFSQEVSNCLNSYAKKFNFKYKRKGGLFGDRYCKYLVESEEEMEMWIDRLNNLEELVLFDKEWQVAEVVELDNERGECSSKAIYENDGECNVHIVFSNFVEWIKQNVRGYFECLPPRHIKAPNYLEKYQNFIRIHDSDPPW